MVKGTIVLEGGAARGVFTSAVLDYLMEQDLYFSNMIGVSAGACNGIGYASKQIGRAKNCMIHEEESFSYMNLRKFVKSKSLMDMDMIFDTFPNKTFPFDYDTYFETEINCLIGVTNCITGKIDFLSETEDKNRLMKICRASSSLPLVSPIVNVDGVPYLDGGLSDSVPIKKALELGEDKIVVVLTRSRGYRKKISSKGINRIYAKSYKKYPELVKSIRRRAVQYNKTMEYIDQLENAGKVFVIRPQIPPVKRMESNPDKLNEFFDHGYRLMEKQYDNLIKYLEIEK